MVALVWKGKEGKGERSQRASFSVPLVRTSKNASDSSLFIHAFSSLAATQSIFLSSPSYRPGHWIPFDFASIWSAYPQMAISGPQKFYYLTQ